MTRGVMKMTSSVRSLVVDLAPKAIPRTGIRCSQGIPALLEVSDSLMIPPMAMVSPSWTVTWVFTLRVEKDGDWMARPAARGDRRAHFLVDHHGHDAARVDPGRDIQRHAAAAGGDRVGEKRTAAGLGAGDRLRGKRRNVLPDVDARPGMLSVAMITGAEITFVFRLSSRAVRMPSKLPALPYQRAGGEHQPVSRTGGLRDPVAKSFSGAPAPGRCCRRRCK